jgi:hypothetical protein
MRMDVWAFAAIFDGYVHNSGASVTLRDPLNGTFGPLLKGDISGPVNGSFEFRSRRNLNDEWVVWLEDISIDAGRGSGKNFARGFVRWAEERYRQCGVEWIEIEARGVGCYVWADLGYRLRDGANYPLTREHEVELMKDWCWERRRLIDHLVSQELVERTLIEDLWRRLDPMAPDALTSPAHLARFGRDHSWREQGRPTWCGRKLLLYAEWADCWFGWKPSPEVSENPPPQ